MMLRTANRYHRRIYWVISGCFLLGAASGLNAQNVDDTIQMLRSDLRADKVTILTKTMKLTDQESAKFWPLQRAYDNELGQIGDKRLALIKEYGANWDSLTDEKAKALGTEALNLDEQVAKLRQKYFKQISKEVSPKVAARYMQVESQIQRMVDLQRGSLIPLVK